MPKDQRYRILGSICLFSDSQLECPKLSCLQRKTIEDCQGRYLLEANQINIHSSKIERVQNLFNKRVDFFLIDEEGLYLKTFSVIEASKKKSSFIEEEE